MVEQAHRFVYLGPSVGSSSTELFWLPCFNTGMCLLGTNVLTPFKRIKRQYWLFLPESILVTGSKSNQIQTLTWMPWSMTVISSLDRICFYNLYLHRVLAVAWPCSQSCWLRSPKKNKTPWSQIQPQHHTGTPLTCTPPYPPAMQQASWPVSDWDLFTLSRSGVVQVK